jgi:hypothetical protein
MTLAIGAEALFTSLVQPSEMPTPTQVRAAIRLSLGMHQGARGCAAVCAAGYGEHPETAVARMRWALGEVSALRLAPAD